MNRYIRSSCLVLAAAVLTVAFNNCGQVASSQKATDASSTDETQNGSGAGAGGVSAPFGTQLVSLSSSLCVRTDQLSPSLETCQQGDTSQNLALVNFDDGSVSLKSIASGDCLSLIASTLQDPTLQFKACNAADTQKFSVLAVNASGYELVSQTHGGCIAVEGSTIRMAKCDLSNAQSFKLSVSSPYSKALEKPLPVTAGPALKTFYKGMHLGGAESGNLTDKNKYGYTFAYPGNALIDYVARKGFSLIRVSFKAGRLQPTRNGALDPVELARLDKVVQYANSKGLYVLLDPHDYGRLPDSAKVGQKIGSPEMPASNFANFWAHVAAAYINQPNVIYGLMNEPNGINAKTWQSSAIAAMNAIRTVGAKQMIFVPGVSWTGAHSWVSSGNAATWANFKDRLSTFEVHQYFDSDSSGTHDVCSTNVGKNRLAVFTAWAAQNGHKGFLGEVGWATNATCDTEAEAAFTHMDQNSGVYLGWSYFGAGWYNGFMTLNPTDLGKATETDKPQTTLILGHL